MKHKNSIQLPSRKAGLLLLALSLLLLTATVQAQDKMEVKDADSNLLMQVNDEGAAGSITLPGLSIAPPVFTNKIYSIGGLLYFNGVPLSSLWSLNGANIFYNSGNVGIGLATAPVSALQVNGTVTATAFVGDGSGLTNLSPGNGWSLTGNAGTVDGTNFLGTTDNVALDFRVNNARGLRLEYAVQGIGLPAPNVIGGYSGNMVTAGIFGATISGGGAVTQANQVTAHWGTVGGGALNVASNIVSTVAGGAGNTASGAWSVVAGGSNNTASGSLSTVSGGGGSDLGISFGNTASGIRSAIPGGGRNTAGGDNSVAAGYRATIDAAHDGAFLFSDGNNFNFNSAAANEFAARATGGVRFVTAIDGAGNPTQTVSISNAGTVTANAFVGDGSGLTGITALGDNLGNHTATQNINLNGTFLSGDGGNEGIFVDANGNVGIGTTTPSELFHINGGNFLLSKLGSNIGTSMTIRGGRLGGADSYAQLDFRNFDVNNSSTDYTGAKIASFNSGSSDDGDLRFSTTSDLVLSERMRITHDGNVGIGTTTPASKFDVNGTVTATAFVGDGSGLTGISGDNLGNHTATQALDLASNNINNGGTVTASAFVGNGSGLTGISGDNLGNHTATQAFNLNGNYLSGDGDSEGVFVDIDGNVGIGTTAPNHLLNVVSNGNALLNSNTVDISNLSAVFRNSINASGNGVGIGFANFNSTLLNVGAAIVHESIGPSTLGNLHFATKGSGVGGGDIPIRMTIRSDGNVGIGTTTPTSKLEVNGTVTASAFVGDGSGLTGISGDNLGNHTATQTLNLANNNVSNGGTVTASAFVGNGSGLTNLPGDNLGNHTATQTLNLANNNVSNGGTVTATAFVGDGSGLTGIPSGADNLGNHIATQTLNLNNNDITNGGTVTATTFVGDGSGLTGIPSGADNLGNHTATQALDMNGNWLTNDANFNNGIFIKTNGNVGIGTANPLAKLDIRPGDDGDPNSDPTNITGLNVDISTFTGTGDKFAALFLGGNVGIGTSNPIRGKLDIQGQSGSTSFNYGFLDNNGNTGTASGSNAYSVYATNRIAAQQFHAHSDRRIKNIKGVSNGGDDLQTLMYIEVTDYTLRDTVEYGHTPQKKVIAQQVARVYPQAVTTDLTEVVPDIYKRAGIEDGWVQLATDLQPGEKVKLISAEHDGVYEVLAVRAGAFQVDWAHDGDVFVYGRQVDDFHTVDYEAISMLNVSATQEMYRLIQQQQQENEALKSQLAQLETQNSKLASQNSAFEKRFAQIELALQKMNGVKLTSTENE